MQYIKLCGGSRVLPTLFMLWLIWKMNKLSRCRNLCLEIIPVRVTKSLTLDTRLRCILGVFCSYIFKWNHLLILSMYIIYQHLVVISIIWVLMCSFCTKCDNIHMYILNFKWNSLAISGYKLMFYLMANNTNMLLYLVCTMFL